MRIEEYNGAGERLVVVCDYYLDLATSLRDSEGRRAIWPCPSCGRASFEASFETGTAGCSDRECQLPASIDLLDLVAYLDPELDAADRQGAGERFAGILHAHIREEQERRQEQVEKRGKARQERRWHKGLEKQRVREQGEVEETLF